jgi:hypothetical protein
VKEWKSETQSLDRYQGYNLTQQNRNIFTLKVMLGCTFPPFHSSAFLLHLATLRRKLSTQVHKYLCIAVNNLCIKALGSFSVHKDSFSSVVIHKLSTVAMYLQRLSGYGEKKILDRLSPYPQSLLLLLNIKISL